ncbi:helix-turn-helix domain-containing protein [Streptomyces sp. SCSIO ZS0520]|uniref:helix-turn-helix domain-containing protein n=1 Tax=Streptomyces sp. SCSIO ZS0520 TaxID=2892996 RepID=UPI0021DADE9B|nr:helix-turn-helix domain-containing protein [Streptomyces sp. SCSIO ZS0520]
MSIKVTNWVWSRSESRNGARLVMLALADRADDQGRAWPSHDDIAERTRLTPRAVRKCIAELVALGELEVESGGGRHRVNRYRIVPKPGTLDRVSDGKPGTLDRVSPPETRNSVPETRNFETGNPELCDRNPEQSSYEPSKNHQENRQGTNPPTPREPEPADTLTAKWWEQYGRNTAQGKSSVRRAIADALRNGLDPADLWSALCRLGDLSKPVTGGTLQFALSELRRPASNVIALPTGQQLTGTDARVAGHAALIAALEAKETSQ